MNRGAESAPEFTPRQGQYLAFIHAYTLVNGRPPAQIDMQPFSASPGRPSTNAARARKRRLDLTPTGVAHSIAVLIQRTNLPTLYPGSTQPVRLQQASRQKLTGADQHRFASA